MAISYLDVAGTYSGPGAYNYNVASYPGGAQIFVNSVTGADQGGRLAKIGASTTTQSRNAQGPIGDPTNPLASVFGANGALFNCKANRGDTIIVAPGHSETIPAAGGVYTIPAGVSIQGGGYGAGRPTFIHGGANVSIGFGGGVQLQNLIFDLTQVAAVVRGFLVNVGGVQFVLCRIIQAGASNQAADAIVLNTGGDDCLIINCDIDASAATGAARAISNPVSNNVNRLQIIDCNIHGDWSGGNISLLSASSAEFNISANNLRNYNAVQKFPLALAAANTLTGYITYNNVMMAGTAATTIYSGGGGTGLCLIQNFMWDTKATASGILAPPAGTP